MTELLSLLFHLILCFCMFSLLWECIVLIKATFPTGREWRVLDPNHLSACVGAWVLPNCSRTAASISDWRQRVSEREGVRELRWPWKKDREGGEKEEVSEVLFLSFPESCLSLNGGKEAQKNCVERRAHGNYFITLAHSRLLRASEFCECVCEWSRSTKPSSQPQSDFPRRAPNTSSHCNILCCTDLFFHDIYSYFGSCSLVLPL